MQLPRLVCLFQKKDKTFFFQLFSFNEISCALSYFFLFCFFKLLFKLLCIFLFFSGYSLLIWMLLSKFLQPWHKNIVSTILYFLWPPCFKMCWHYVFKFFIGAEEVQKQKFLTLCFSQRDQFIWSSTSWVGSFIQKFIMALINFILR